VAGAISKKDDGYARILYGWFVYQYQLKIKSFNKNKKQILLNAEWLQEDKRL